jgi:hypothetical protein
MGGHGRPVFPAEIIFVIPPVGIFGFYTSSGSIPFFARCLAREECDHE